MASVSLTAIVLSRRDLGEADRIVTLLTREAGKLDAVAKGARRPGSKSAGVSEAFTEARIQMAEGRRLGIVTQWSVLHSFGELRTDLGMLARASYLCELTDRLVEEHEPCPDAFDLLAAALSLLGLGACAPDTVVHAYEIRLLTERGYAPILDRCVRCSEPVSAANPAGRALHAVSAALGGIVCPSCAGACHDGVRLLPHAVSVLRTLANGAIDDLAALQWARPVSDQVEACVSALVRFHCDREVRSGRFLQVVRMGEG
jgi:DNA repair protein RecO (recombination protein O)